MQDISIIGIIVAVVVLVILLFYGNRIREGTA